MPPFSSSPPPSSSLLTSEDGTRLYSHTWDAEAPLLGTIYFIHGLGEHIHRYDRMFTHFNQAGFRVKGFDQRGHGRTALSLNPEMVPGHVGSFEKVLSDIDALLKDDLNQLPSKDIGKIRILMGHSMGGLLVLYYLLKQDEISKSPTATTGLVPITGAIISAPALATGQPISPFKLWWGRAMAPLIPKFTLNGQIPITNISRRPTEVESFLKDPLCHQKVSLQTAANILDWGEKLRKVKQPNSMISKVPILLIHGTDDIITSHAASEKFMANLDCADKTFVSFPGGYHNCKNIVFFNKNELI